MKVQYFVFPIVEKIDKELIEKFVFFINNLTILIPFYNERKRIATHINHLRDYLFSLSEFLNNYKKASKIRVSVLYVNDGSRDHSCEMLNEKLNELKSDLEKMKNLSFRYEIVGYEINKGKGFAEKYGMKFVNKKFVLVCDFDFSTPLFEIVRFLPFLDYDAVIGSRWLNPKLTHYSFERKFLSKLAVTVIDFFLGLNFHDTQCGFKLFNSDIAKKIFAIAKLNRFGIDFEVLYIAKLMNAKIKEVSVKWDYNKNSKINLLDYLKTLKELFRVRVSKPFYLKRLKSIINIRNSK